MKSVLLFLLAFGSQQIMIFLNNARLLPGWIQSSAYLPIQVLFIFVSILLLKAEGASLAEHGFSFPQGTDTFFAVSIFLATVYILVITFLPGSVEGFIALPAVAVSLGFFLTSASILIAAVTIEIVFRGYIQTNLKKSIGLWPALIASSAMSAIYMLPLSLYPQGDSMILPTAALTLLAESFFLSVFFDETKTLIPTITYSASVALLYNFTPLRAISTDYTPAILIVTYIFLTPVMLLLVTRRTQMIRPE
jgi:membrane protease YdiL (CAAX protease family)